jgi:hypothetical protein
MEPEEVIEAIDKSEKLVAENPVCSTITSHLRLITYHSRIDGQSTILGNGAQVCCVNPHSLSKVEQANKGVAGMVKLKVRWYLNAAASTFMRAIAVA